MPKRKRKLSHKEVEQVIAVLNLGAGVQSTTMALMAARGEIEPMPDFAVFADTGSEPRAVYEHLWNLVPKLPFPVYIAMKDDGLTMHLEEAAAGESFTSTGGMRFVTPPLFAESVKREGRLPRQCTAEFKLKPIYQMIRKAMRFRKGARMAGNVLVENWIGISLDEAQRMKPSREPWAVNRWPLVDLGMSRADCLLWMREHGYPEPPRSACVYCPFHSEKEWDDLKRNDPEGFAEAVRVDNFIRGGAGKITNKLYVHRSCRPLEEVDFKVDDDTPDQFGNECEGMCGV